MSTPREPEPQPPSSEDTSANDTLACSNEEPGGGEEEGVDVRGYWDGESQAEGNKRPVVHGLGL